jgi:hypothetical protein
MPANISVSTLACVKLTAKLVAAGTRDVLFASVEFMAPNSAVVVITGGNATSKSTLSPEVACVCASRRCNRLLDTGLVAAYLLIVTFSGDTLAAAAIAVFRVASNMFLKVVFARSERSTASNVIVPFT